MFLLIAFLILIPILLGNYKTAICPAEKSCAISVYIEGTFLSLLLVGIIALPIIKLEKSFATYLLLLGICLLILCGMSFTISEVRESVWRFPINAWKRQIARKKEEKRRKRTLFFWLFFCILFLQLLSFYFCLPVVHGDMTAETVRTILRTNTIYQYNPATGRALTIGMYPIEKVVILPVLYATLGKISSIPVIELVYTIMNLWILLLHYLVISEIGRRIFTDTEKEDKREMFLFFCAFLHLFGDYFVKTPSYLLLHQGYTGSAWLYLLILPYLSCILYDLISDGFRFERIYTLAILLMVATMTAGVKLTLFFAAIAFLASSFSYFTRRNNE